MSPNVSPVSQVAALCERRVRKRSGGSVRTRAGSGVVERAPAAPTMSTSVVSSVERASSRRPPRPCCAWWSACCPQRDESARAASGRRRWSASLRCRKTPLLQVPRVGGARDGRCGRAQRHKNG